MATLEFDAADMRLITVKEVANMPAVFESPVSVFMRQSMTSEEKLEDIVYSSKSKIHGTGLFAKRPIKKGEHIGTYEGPTAKRNGTYVLWVYEEENKKPVGRRGKNLLRYLNHSVPGNAEFDGFDLYARVKIMPGEEITFDYKEFD